MTIFSDRLCKVSTGSLVDGHDEIVTLLAALVPALGIAVFILTAFRDRQKLFRAH